MPVPGWDVRILDEGGKEVGMFVFCQSSPLLLRLWLCCLILAQEPELSRCFGLPQLWALPDTIGPPRCLLVFAAVSIATALSHTVLI